MREGPDLQLRERMNTNEASRPWRVCFTMTKDCRQYSPSSQKVCTARLKVGAVGLPGKRGTSPEEQGTGTGGHKTGTPQLQVLSLAMNLGMPVRPCSQTTQVYAPVSVPFPLLSCGTFQIYLSGLEVEEGAQGPAVQGELSHRDKCHDY